MMLRQAGVLRNRRDGRRAVEGQVVPFRGRRPRAEFTPKTVETPELRTDLVYRLRVVVEDADERLLQGMPVTVRLLGDGPEPAQPAAGGEG